MSVPTHRTPSYRLHKPSGQAVTTISGRDYYLGHHGSPESRAEYDRLVATWLSHGRRLPAPALASCSEVGLTVNELALAYVRWAEGYYRKGGEVTGEVAHVKYAVRHVRLLYGETPAGSFGPLALKVVRQSMIEPALAQKGRGNLGDPDT